MLRRAGVDTDPLKDEIAAAERYGCELLDDVRYLNKDDVEKAGFTLLWTQVKHVATQCAATAMTFVHGLPVEVKSAVW